MATCAVTPFGNSQFRGAAILVHRQRAGALLLERLGHLQGAAFHAEVQIANAESAEHVAHSAAGQKQVDAGGARGRLHLFQHAVLVRAQVALQHEHIVAHGVPYQALGWCSSTVFRSRDRMTWV
jgi:hypothetical protein